MLAVRSSVFENTKQNRKHAFSKNRFEKNLSLPFIETGLAVAHDSNIYYLPIAAEKIFKL